MIQCTAVHLEGGQYHEHIASIRFIGEGGGTKTRAQMVAYVEAGNVAYCEDKNGKRANLAVRTSITGTKYVQTYADKVWTDNLLALPHF